VIDHGGERHLGLADRAHAVVDAALRAGKRRVRVKRPARTHKSAIEKTDSPWKMLRRLNAPRGPGQPGFHASVLSWMVE
jgi:hypothetical protein